MDSQFRRTPLPATATIRGRTANLPVHVAAVEVNLAGSATVGRSSTKRIGAASSDADAPSRTQWLSTPVPSCPAPSDRF